MSGIVVVYGPSASSGCAGYYGSWVAGIGSGVYAQVSKVLTIFANGPGKRSAAIVTIAGKTHCLDGAIGGLDGKSGVGVEREMPVYS
jgi:hypothetical protein